MSYQGVGSYYTFQPHEVYAGYGSGVGSYYEIPQPMSGFGAFADTFSAQQVWNDAQLGGSCFTPGNANFKACEEPTTPACGQCNAAGARATKQVQAALNQLGYGPMAVDGKWGSGTSGAWKRYLADNGLTPGPGLGLSEQGLALMERQLKGGEKPGSGEKIEFENVNGQLIPKKGSGIATAGLSGGTLLLAALVAGGIGFAAWKAGKKKKGGRTAAMTLR